MTRIWAGAVLVLCGGVFSPGYMNAAQAQEASATEKEAPAKVDSQSDSKESTSTKDAGASDADQASAKTASENKVDVTADSKSTPAGKAEKADDSKPDRAAPSARNRRDFRPDRGAAAGDAKSGIGDFTAAGAGANVEGNETRQKLLSFKFVKDPWAHVLELFAKESGLTLDLDETPSGTFTYTDNKRYTPTEALDIINGYLLKRGFLLIRRDEFLVVWNTDSPPPPNLIPVVSRRDLKKLGRNEYVTVIFPLDSGVDAKAAAEEVSDLVGPQGKVKALVKSNQLRVSDIASILILVGDFLDDFAPSAEGKAMTFRSFALVHISASEAERQLREAFGLPARGSQNKAATDAQSTTRPQNQNNNRGGAGTDWRSMFGRGGGFPGFPGGGGGGFPGFPGGGGFPGAGGGAPAGGGGDAARGDDAGGRRGRGGRGDRNGGGGDRGSGSDADEGTFKIIVSADTRMNRLHVTASHDEMRLVEEAVKEIDVKHDASERLTPRNPGDPELHVYPVETAELDVVVDVLNMIVPGIVIHDDAKTHRLNIYASPNEHKEVAKTIKLIDAGAGDLVAVVQLNRLPPTAAATSFKSLFATNNKGGDPPTIEADEVGRRLMMRGTPEQISQIKKLLTEMGEMGRAAGNGMRRGQLAIISPQGRSSDDIVSLLERALPRGENRFIRIVDPSEFGKPVKRPSLFDRRDDSSQLPRSGDRSAPFGASAGDRGRNQRSVTLPAGIPADELRREVLGRIRNIDEDQAPENSKRGRRPAADADSGTGETSASGKADPCGETLANVDERAADAAEERESPEKQPAEKPPVEKAPVETGSSRPAQKSVENSESDSRPAAPRARPDVQITVDGDRILIYCEDEDELNRIEALIENLASAPPKTKWTVYPLKTPDSAESTAVMLGHLFPEGSVTRTQQQSNTNSGLFSLFGPRNNASDAAGLNNNLSKAGTLKIIPEVRANSLYITGPEDIVAQVLEAVKFLDNSESLADRKAQRITLKHARVMEVADHLFDLFREEMGYPVQNNMQNRNGFQQGGFQGGFGGNPFGGFNPMMAGNNQQQNQRPTKVQLNIAPDTRTNTLWVFANDNLFQKVEETVRWIDNTVHESKPTVRVYSMSKTNSAVVQQTLTALVEGVHTSTSSGIAANNSSNGGFGQRGQQAPFGQGFGNRQGPGGQGFGGQGFGGQGFGGQGFGGQGFGQGFGGQGFGQGFGGQGFGGQGFGGQGFGQGVGGQGFRGQGGGGQGFGGQGFGGGGRGGGGRGGGGGGRGFGGQ